MFAEDIKKATEIKEVKWGFYRITREWKGGRLLTPKDPFKWIVLDKKGNLIGKVKVDANSKGDWIWTTYGTRGFDVLPETRKTAKGAFGALIKAHKKFQKESVG
jgi:hypothetical protein